MTRYELQTRLDAAEKQMICLQEAINGKNSE